MGKKILSTPFALTESNKSFRDIEDIAKFAGAASSVLARLPRSNEQNPGTLIISAQTNPDLHELMKGGWRCFTKDIITISILRGKIDTDSDEFLVFNLNSGLANKRKKQCSPNALTLAMMFPYRNGYLGTMGRLKAQNLALHILA